MLFIVIINKLYDYSYNLLIEIRFRGILAKDINMEILPLELRNEDTSSFVNSEHKLFMSLCSEVPPVNNNILELKNENQIHWRCIQYFRKMYPDHVKHIHAGLGEIQTDDWVRIDAWRKGYVKGLCDFFLPLQNKTHFGLCVEFKNPNGTGVLSKEQQEYLEEMEDYGYKTGVVSDYDVWVKLLDDYMSSVRFPCKFCSRGFISKESLYDHNLYKHHYNTKTRENNYLNHMGNHTRRRRNISFLMAFFTSSKRNSITVIIVREYLFSKERKLLLIQMNMKLVLQLLKLNSILIEKLKVVIILIKNNCLRYCLTMRRQVVFLLEKLSVVIIYF